MTRKSKDIDKTPNGRKRVRLNGAKGANRKTYRSRKDMEKVWAARDESRAKAPRHGRGKGFAANNYRFKQLVEIHNTSNYAPKKRTAFNPDSKEFEKRRNVPLFIRKPERADKMIEMIGRGVPPGTVCRYAGVSYHTFKNWLEIGAEGTNPIYVEFLARVAKAEAEAEVHLIEKMDAHHDDDWKSVAWMLERRWPEHWARRDKHEVQGEITVNKKEKLAERVVDDPEALDLARKMLEDGTEVFSLPDDDMIIDEGSDDDV